MEEIKAPNSYDKARYSVFLAGSIERGKAEQWQDKIADMLSEFDVQVLNPRRDDWDLSWEQVASNPEFKKQVLWELDAQESADLIVMYFDENTKSPITLMELGLFVKQKPIIVCCPKKFWRQGNVQIVGEKYGAVFTDNKQQFEKIIKERLVKKGIKNDK
jgi:hypothetical protein